MRLPALQTVFCFAVLASVSQASSFDDLAARASAAREANDIPQALELYKQALQLNPKWEEGWWFAGSLLYDADHYAEGREALAHVVQLDPKAGPAWGLLGLCEFETHDYAAALKDISRSLEIDSSIEPQMEGVLRFHQAVLLTRTGAFDKAVDAYGWFVRKGVRNASVISGIGLAALRTSLVPEEIPAAQQDLYSNAGQAAYLTIAGDYPQAERILQQLLERYPNAQYVHYMHGRFLLAANPELAIQELRRELDVNPKSAAASAMLAWALLERDDAAGALPFAQRAVREDPNFEVAQYVFGRSLAEQGQVNPGIEHLERAEKLDPANVQAHISLATAYSKAGRPQDARRERLLSVALAQGKGSVAQP
jgi:tetratricopeptide (TPR) repeat protein